MKKFKEFITENINNGTPLRNYFFKNSLQHNNIIGKKVITNDGEIWYINKIDPVTDTKLPYQIFCSKKPDSDFGIYINTNELYITDDVDLINN